MFIRTLPHISPWSGFTKAVALLQGRAALLRGLGGAAAPPYQFSFGRSRLNSRDGYVISQTTLCGPQNNGAPRKGNWICQF
jgi:hypothetical protein